MLLSELTTDCITFPKLVSLTFINSQMTNNHKILLY